MTEIAIERAEEYDASLGGIDRERAEHWACQGRKAVV